MKWVHALMGSALALASLGAATPSPTKSVAAAADAGPIVAMRRLTEQQYRNSIADIFGTDIIVAGRFEPIVRPQHQLIATGASESTISPAGLEQYDSMARAIAAQVFDDQHRAVFVPCATSDLACARQTLGPMGRYLFRRPMAAAEINAYAEMAVAGADKAGSFAGGLQLALAAMLVSPNFLYVIESAEPDPTQPGALQLDAWSRASRLSFLLWDSSPNDALLAAAQMGALNDQAKLEAMASKMIASPRFANGVRAFFADMLIFEKFDDLAKDSIIYPRFNQNVAKALPEQMLRTITGELVTRGSDYRDLFTTRNTQMTRDLGTLYQVPVKARTGWVDYQFGPDDDRAGLLSQAGFLAMYSHSGRSSATLRGRAIRELLMCEPVPNPPGNVNFTAVQDVHNVALPTARDRLQRHANDPSCSGCHNLTDPIGLTLERFDGIGSFRLSENGSTIDTAAKFGDVEVTGAATMGRALAANPATTACLASRALEYATGRAVDDAADLTRAFGAQGYRIAPLFLKVATMPDSYRVPSADTQGAQP